MRQMRSKALCFRLVRPSVPVCRVWLYVRASGQGHSPTGLMVRALDLWLKRSRVRFPAVLLSSNNVEQVVRSHMPLSPSSILLYWSWVSDVLRLGR